MTQNEQVLQYIERHGSIDPLRALNELGVMRLAARIANLRAMGHNIVTETMRKKTPDGVKSWAEYKKAAPRLATENGKGVGEVGHDSTSKNITLHQGGQE